MLLISHIPKPGDWEILGVIDNHLTWLAIKPEAEIFVFEHHKHLETCFFEKGARISIKPGENGQELRIEPEKALIKRTVIT